MRSLEAGTADVSEADNRQADGVEHPSVDSLGKVPLTVRLMLGDSLTARRAAAIIAAFTVVVTVAGGVFERLLDHQEYPTIGKGLWLALQTVTTVGYGDVTPMQASGRFIATVVMLAGIGLLAVITASVTASLVESGRRRFTAQSEADDTRQFDEIRPIGKDRSGTRAAGVREVARCRPLTRPSDQTRDERGPPDSAPANQPARRSRIRRMFSGSRDLWRVVYRDPEHVPERLTLYTANRLGDASREWARSVRSSHPDTPVAKIAEELRTQSAHVARIDGAISGTPFFIALVPGYLTYLQQEMRMTLRTAALYGRDPRELRTSAEMLALRGVHTDVEAAEAALISVRDKGLPDRPERRRSWRTWVHSVYLLLIFGGFMSPSVAKEDTGARGKVRAVFGVALGVGIWVTTWVLPLTFMIVMAWGCETHARQLGRRTLLYYDGEADNVLEAIKAADARSDRGHDKRAIARGPCSFPSRSRSASLATPSTFATRRGSTGSVR